MKRLLAILLTCLLLLGAVPALAIDAGTIVYPIEDDPQQMDPTLNSYSRSSMVLQQLFRGLYKLAPNGNEYVPCMAESYTQSEDLKTYTFKLKADLKFSDGSPLTAHDFEYSWKRVLNPETASKCNSDLWVLKNGKAYAKGEMTVDQVGVKALDDLTLEVTTENLCPWFLSLTATTSYFPVKKAVVEAAEPWTKSAATYVSNGPYMLSDISPLEHVKMVKNPNYVDADQVIVENLNYVIISDQATELTAYNNGDINVSDNLSPDAVAQYRDTPEFFALGRIGIQYSDFNCESPEFSDKRVRQAFSMSIDRNAIVTALRIADKPVFGFIPYSQKSLSDPTKSYREVAGDMIVEDVPAAKALMAEAGYPDGAGFPTIKIVAQANNEQKLYAQMLGEMWKTNLGVNYEIITYESATYWDELDQGNYSVDRNAFTCDYLDPVANLNIFTTGSNAYENRWDDPAYDEMITAANQMTDQVEREKALIAAEKYVADLMPVMPVYSMMDTFLVKPGLTGVIKNPIGHINFEYAKFE
ncbi:MAG: peptide ABC transporter substrate-binding protein [Clostridia bacterium]